VTKELDAGYGLPQLAYQSFWATEAALSFGVLTHNRVVLCERKLGWLEAVTVSSLRYWLLVTAGVISHLQGKRTIKLAVPTRERDRGAKTWGEIARPLSQLQCSRESAAADVAQTWKNQPQSAFHCKDTAEAWNLPFRSRSPLLACRPSAFAGCLTARTCLAPPARP
jgi:hypothetical protein